MSTGTRPNTPIPPSLPTPQRKIFLPYFLPLLYKSKYQYCAYGTGGQMDLFIRIPRQQRFWKNLYLTYSVTRGKASWQLGNWVVGHNRSPAFLLAKMPWTCHNLLRTSWLVNFDLHQSGSHGLLRRGTADQNPYCRWVWKNTILWLVVL